MKGLLIVLSGFSGSGKGTVMRALLKKYDQYQLSISATTRKPRDGEVDGQDYFFLTRDDFESMIEKEQFVEWAEYVSNYYGTPKKYLEEQIEKGNRVILEIEMQGALSVKNQYPDALLLFLGPPNFEELKNRLVNRKTEDESTIRRRLARSYEETEFVPYYDYFIINDTVDSCVETIHDIIEKEHEKKASRDFYLEHFKKEYDDFLKGE